MMDDKCVDCVCFDCIKTNQCRTCCNCDIEIEDNEIDHRYKRTECGEQALAGESK